jgi:hypothetical protein
MIVVKSAKWGITGDVNFSKNSRYTSILCVVVV